MSSARQNPSGKNRKQRLHPIVAIVIAIVLALAGYLVYSDVAEHNPSPGLADGEVAVHFIDVGQGDAVLIQTTSGSVLIDGGNSNMGMRVVEYIRDIGVSELAYVVATHPHSDHIGGLVTVLNEIPVGTLIMPNVAHTTATFERFLDAIENNDIPLREPVIGSSFSIGNAVFTVIAPNADNYISLNDYSVSLRMVLGDTGFIFTGDAEALSEREMLQHYISSDVLHVGHHGSNTSTIQEFLDAVSPSIAIISVCDNTYGHPHDDVLARLYEAHVTVYRTDYHGHILIVSDGANLSIYTTRGAE